MAKLKEKVKGIILKGLELGVYEPGALLPSIRDLASKTSVSRNTVLIALQELAQEGMLTSSPNRGFRATLSTKKKPSGIIASIYLIDKYDETPNTITPLLNEYLRMFGNHFGYSIIDISNQMKSKSDILKEMKKLEVCGVIIDTYDQDFIKILGNKNIPSIMLGSAVTHKKFSSVLQDNFQGGLLAANYFLEKGLNNFIWFGPTNNSIHAIERIGGVMAGLNTKNKYIDPNKIIDAEHDHSRMNEYKKSLESILSQTNKPVGIFALWRNSFIEAIRVTKKLNLQINKDVHIIGWSMEELPDIFDSREFNKSDISPYMTWSGKTLAKCAIEYFNTYKGIIPSQPIHICVPITINFLENK